MPDKVNRPIGITMTGVDERTSIDDIVRLADLGVEIGILYTFDPESRHRYPPLPWIGEVVRELIGRCSLHICGKRARKELLEHRLDWLTDLFPRVQVNGVLTCDEVEALCLMMPGKTIITQHYEVNRHLLAVGSPNHAILVDASGGRGQLPSSWERPETNKAVGFAGGLGPATLRGEWPKIASVAANGSWVDMEGQLRDEDDWFDAWKAMEVVEMWRSLNA